VSRKRPWLAALLAFLYPGLGHVYLRAWLRALAWFLLAMLTAALVVPPSVIQAMETGGWEALLTATESLPPEALVPLFAVRGLNILDAYLLARRSNAPQADASGPDAGAGAGASPETCPNCGRDLDEDLDFCPWCTYRLDGDGDGEADAEEGSGPTSR
jgi:hypothetical protein